MNVLIHDPLGRQHPYEAAAFERTPALPVAGDAVTIGIVTRPARAWRDLRVEWWAGDAPAQCVEAALVDSGSFELRADEVAAGASNDAVVVEQEDRWVAVLPGVEAGVVRYRIEGRNESGAVQSEVFEFGVARWMDALPVDGGEDRIGYRLEGIEAKVELRWRADEFGLRLGWLAEGAREEFAGGADEAGSVVARLDDTGCLIFERDGKVILREALSPQFLAGQDGSVLRVRHSFSAAPDERFYGLGERYNALNQRGETLDVRVYEQYKNQGKRTYMPVPLLHSSAGYSFYLHSNRWSAFDLGATDDRIWRVEAELGEEAGLEISLFATGSVAGNLAAYCAQTGLPKMPPEWAFSLWASSNDWETQRHVEEEVRQAQAHGIPIGVVVLEAWSDEVNFYIWNDAQYGARTGADRPRLGDFTFPAEGKWPNPKQMIDDLHAQGIRLMLWQIPVLKHVTESALKDNAQHDADEAHMLDAGFAVTMANGTPYRVRPPWFRGSLLPDFTSPAASAWWFGKRRYLVEEMGVDGFKTDGGEHLWARETRFADGRQGNELVNTYPLEYTRAYTEFLDETKPGDGLLFSRAGYAGAQRYPAHWAGDEVSTWEAYRASVLAMLNAGLSGIPFIGWDIGGFSGPIPSAELYLRAAAMSVFCPIMQYHSEYWRGTPSRDRSPWNMQASTDDERVVPYFRRFVEWRTVLRPYIVASARESARTGAPLMRALPVDFMEDARCAEYPLQYLFGESLLVAPVMEAGVTSQSVYLPRGERWVDVWSGVEYEGGVEVTINAPLERIPLFLRGGRANPLVGVLAGKS